VCVAIADRIPTWLVMTSPDVSARLRDPTYGELPKFMPPVSLDSLTPHPYLPLQPDGSQFIIPPKALQSTVPASATKSGQEPKDILAAAKSGSLKWIKDYCTAGQTELTDSLGEVRSNIVVTDVP
jgi:hypothetical protein